jgi:hypothetical protein
MLARQINGASVVEAMNLCKAPGFMLAAKFHPVNMSTSDEMKMPCIR